VGTIKLEELPPSWGHWACDSKFVGSTAWWNFHAVVLPVVVSDQLGYWVEEPLLSFVVSVSVKHDVVVSMSLSNSLHWKSWLDDEWSVDMESEFFILTLVSNLLWFINVDNIPSLVGSSVSAPCENWLSFDILSTWDIKCFLGLEVDEVFTFILPELPPVGIGAPDLHVGGSSWGLNVPWLVVQLGSDGQGLLMEVPFLGVSSISSLDDHVSAVNNIKISSWSQFGDNVEWSFDVETEHFVKFSLFWLSWVNISVDDIPLLVDSLMFVPDNDVSVLGINSTMDIHGLSSLIDDVSALKSE
jgi:hypothetical protein